MARISHKRAVVNRANNKQLVKFTKVENSEAAHFVKQSLENPENVSQLDTLLFRFREFSINGSPSQDFEDPKEIEKFTAKYISMYGVHHTLLRAIAPLKEKLFCETEHFVVSTILPHKCDNATDNAKMCQLHADFIGRCNRLKKLEFFEESQSNLKTLVTNIGLRTPENMDGSKFELRISKIDVKIVQALLTRIKAPLLINLGNLYSRHVDALIYLFENAQCNTEVTLGHKWTRGHVLFVISRIKNSFARKTTVLEKELLPHICLNPKNSMNRWNFFVIIKSGKNKHVLKVMAYTPLAEGK